MHKHLSVRTYFCRLCGPSRLLLCSLDLFLVHITLSFTTKLFVANLICRGSGYGPFLDIVIGIIGAIVGGWIMRAVGFQGQGGMLYTILVAIGGAVVLTLLYRLIMRTSGAGRGAGPTRIDEGQGSSKLRKVA